MWTTGQIIAKIDATFWDVLRPIVSNRFVMVGIVLLLGAVVFVVLRAFRLRRVMVKMRGLENTIADHVDANNTPDGIRRPEDGSPKPSV